MPGWETKVGTQAYRTRICHYSDEGVGSVTLTQEMPLRVSANRARQNHGVVLLDHYLLALVMITNKNKIHRVICIKAESFKAPSQEDKVKS